MAKPDAIMKEAKARFKRCQEWESDSRVLFTSDRKFANADSDNGWQWDDVDYNGRRDTHRPCLTINKTRQHNLQIINDARQNKPAINIRPVSNGATYQASQVFQAIVRHIEYVSNAQSVYDRATVFQVEAGIGYWRVCTDYADDESLDQEIFIRSVKDPLSIYMDPDMLEADGSDARFCFIFDDMPHDEVEAKFPQFKDALPGQDALGEGNDWLNKDHVRVAEYFRKTEYRDELLSYVDGQTGERKVVRKSAMPDAVVEGLKADPETRTREATGTTIEWYMIIGGKVVEKKEYPGLYIPIVRVVGEETVIEGRLDRKGHTRALKDCQRQYNFWTSGAAEFVALQTKSPFVGSVAAIEGLEKYWSTANTETHAILPYNDRDESGQEIRKPERAEPPVMAPAFVQGMSIARQELMEVSGQYQAEMGAPSNERSGKAIQERQRQGDNATYHFIDHLSVAIRFTGKIILDLIPKIYDTPRIMQLLNEDGTTSEVSLDPALKSAYKEDKDEQGLAVERVFNPNVGKYDVQADTGPDYGTKRQEAFNAIMDLMKASPEVMQIAGDLLFQSADFPLADELAERFRRMVPAQALGGQNPEVQQLQQQLQQAQSVIQQGTKLLEDEKNKADIEAYKATTQRLALGTDIDPMSLIPAIQAAIMSALQQAPVPHMPQGMPDMQQGMGA